LGLIPNDSKSAKLAQKALTHERPEVRAAAAALGNMQSRASIPKLKAAMDGNHKEFSTTSNRDQIAGTPSVNAAILFCWHIQPQNIIDAVYHFCKRPQLL
jgi:hypothetical protein